MLKALVLFLLTLLVVHVETHSQTHKAQSEAQSSKPTLPIAASVVPKQNNGQTLQPKNDDHVDADIRIISAPARDLYDRAGFWISVVLVTVGVAGIIVAICSLRAIGRQAELMKRQADVMEGQLKEMQEAGQRAERQLVLTESEVEIAHRAYLAPGTPDTALSGETRVPIENYGKIAACVTSVRLQQVQYGKDRKEIYRKEGTVAVDNKFVAPGRASDYAILFDAQPVTAETLASMVGIVVEYDTGFGKTDTLSAFFSRDPRGGWARGNTIFDPRAFPGVSREPV